MTTFRSIGAYDIYMLEFDSFHMHDDEGAYNRNIDLDDVFAVLVEKAPSNSQLVNPAFVRKCLSKEKSTHHL